MSAEAAAMLPAASSQQVAAPTFSIASGTYSDTQTVTISDATPGATIYYSTNGTFVGPLSPLHYTGPITVSSSEIVVAMATAPGLKDSDTVYAEYLISSVPTSFVYTIAGNGRFGYGGDGLPGPSAMLGDVMSAVADRAGSLYIADSFSNVIRKVDVKTGLISTIAGTGLPASTGDGGPAKDASLNGPQYLAIDGSGNLFIGETGDAVVRKISTSTGIITRYAGGGTGPLGGPAIDYPLGSISSMACDPSGNLLLGSGFQILRVDAQTGIISNPAPNYYAVGVAGIAGDNAGNIYFSDGWVYSKVYKIDFQGNVTVFAGGGYGVNIGDGGPAVNARLSLPQGLALDSSGNLYIADNGEDLIRKVDRSGIISTYAGVLYDPYTVGGAGDPASSVGMEPTSLSFDGSGNLYVTEYYLSQIQMVTPPGAIPTTMTPAPGFTVAGGTYATDQALSLTESAPGSAIYLTFDGTDPLTSGQIVHGPIDLTGAANIKAVAVAPGQLKSSISSASYQVTQPPMAVINSVAGTGRYGFSGAGGPATSASIGSSEGVAVDAIGNVYFSDSSNNVVWMVSAGSGNASIVAGNGTQGYSGDGGPATAAELSVPSGLAVDAAGNLYIADFNHRVRMVSAKTGIITTFAGGGIYSTTEGDGGPATSAYISRPQSLAFDSKGNLYIGDVGSFLVRRVDAKTGIISTVAGATHSRLPGNGGPATAAEVIPNGIAFDASDNLYIADGGFGRICKVDATTGILTTIGGGTSDPLINGDGILATQAYLEPWSVALDAKGNVYFSDLNAVVRVIDATTGLLSTPIGNSYDGDTGDGGSAKMASIGYVHDISFDKNGALYLAGSSSYSIRKVTFFGPAATPVLSLAGGTYTGQQSVTITDTTPNATIYYTLDGSAPDTQSAVYSGALTVKQNETLQAIAVASGYTESAIVKASYIINYLTANITVTSSANPVLASSPVKFTATLTATSGTPSGTVTFLDGTQTLGTGTVSNGAATYTTSSLAGGTHSITASYGGDTVFNVSTSAAIVETVQDFTFATGSSGSSSATVAPGGTATYTLAVTPPSGQTTPVDVTFSVTGLPAGATATFNPAKVPARSAATTVTLSVSVPASAAVHAQNSGWSKGIVSEGAPLALGMCLLPFAAMRRVRRRLGAKLVLGVLLLAGIGAAVGLSGCGGGGSSSGGSNGPKTYNLTVTATAGTLTHTTNLTLTVQ